MERCNIDDPRTLPVSADPYLVHMDLSADAEYIRNTTWCWVIPIPRASRHAALRDFLTSRVWWAVSDAREHQAGGKRCSSPARSATMYT